MTRRTSADLESSSSSLAISPRRASSLSMPVGALQAAQAVGQHSLGKQAPHRATDQRTIDAFGKILFGRNAEAVGDDVDIGGRVAHLDAGDGLLGRLPVAGIIDLRKTFDALVRPHAIEKIVSDFSRARLSTAIAARSRRGSAA